MNRNMTNSFLWVFLLLSLLGTLILYSCFSKTKGTMISSLDCYLYSVIDDFTGMTQEDNLSPISESPMIDFNSNYLLDELK